VDSLNNKLFLEERDCDNLVHFKQMTVNLKDNMSIEDISSSCYLDNGKLSCVIKIFTTFDTDANILMAIIALSSYAILLPIPNVPMITR
jgi:hypothetical protein